MRRAYAPGRSSRRRRIQARGTRRTSRKIRSIKQNLLDGTPMARRRIGRPSNLEHEPDVPHADLGLKSPGRPPIRDEVAVRVDEVAPSRAFEPEPKENATGLVRRLWIPERAGEKPHRRDGSDGGTIPAAEEPAE